MQVGNCFSSRVESPTVFCKALFWVLSFSPYIRFHSVIFFRNIIYHIISMPTTLNFIVIFLFFYLVI